jgi:hypothetical protein
MKRSQYCINFFILYLISSAGFGQTFNLQSIPKDVPQLSFTFEKPYFGQDNIEEELLNGVFQLSANFSVGEKVNIIVSIPFVKVDYQRDSYYAESRYYSEAGFGNLFVGMQLNPPKGINNHSIISFGVYLPTAQEAAARHALFNNYYNLESYYYKTLGLYFNYAYHRSFQSGFNYGFEIGPNVLIPAEERYGGNELFLHFGGRVGYKVNDVTASIEYLGMMIVSSGIDSFYDRIIQQLNVGANWNAGIFSPKIYYRLYLREIFSEFIDGVLGVGVDVEFDFHK